MFGDIASEASRARKDTIRHFRELGATSAETAIIYQPQYHLERRALAYLTGKSIVQLSAEGKYWLDAEAAERWRRSMRTQNALIVGGVAAVLAAFAVTRYRRRAGQEETD
jgi:hypothetical protein